jgi:nitroreductase
MQPQALYNVLQHRRSLHLRDLLPDAIDRVCLEQMLEAANWAPSHGHTDGIVIATLAFFVANRLLPLGVSFAGAERATLEMWAFCGVWVATCAHAGLRVQRAWVEQSWAITTLALTAVLLNAITTGDHLLKTLAAGQWGVAGMDALLLVVAGIAAWAARRLQSRALGGHGAPTATPGQAQSMAPAAEQAAATTAPVTAPPPARGAGHA